MNPTNADSFTKALDAGFTPEQILTYLGIKDQTQQQPSFSGGQSIFQGASPQVTENFGDQQPGLEVFSNGQTLGTGLGVPEGTPVALPPGQWEVMDSYAGDQNHGQIGDGTNSGYGNSALVRNTKTGEKLRFSHLQENYLPKGYTIPGGVTFGKIGDTGNTTGSHLNLEYYDQTGNLGDVLQTPYAQYLGVKQ